MTKHTNELVTREKVEQVERMIKSIERANTRTALTMIFVVILGYGLFLLMLLAIFGVL